DLGGNRLLWAMGALAYQLLHVIRTTALTGSWRRAQPERIRSWILRLPAKLTRHARKTYVQLQRAEPVRAEFLHALRSIARLRAPPFGDLASCEPMQESRDRANRRRSCSPRRQLPRKCPHQTSRDALRTTCLATRACPSSGLRAAEPSLSDLSHYVQDPG